jgi:hypothetical protein
MALFAVVVLAWNVAYAKSMETTFDCGWNTKLVLDPPGTISVGWFGRFGGGWFGEDVFINGCQIGSEICGLLEQNGVKMFFGRRRVSEQEVRITASKELIEALHDEKVSIGTIRISIAGSPSTPPISCTVVDRRWPRIAKVN